MVTLNPTEEQFYKLTESGMVVVDFWASWCGPCRSQSPIVEQLEKTTDVDLIKIDVDADDVLPVAFGVTSIPTLVLYKDGEMIKRLVGLTSLDELKAEFGL